MTTSYDWATDTTTIVSNITTELVYPVSNSFTVITTLVRRPETGSMGIKVRDAANELYLSVGPKTGANVITPLPESTYIAMQWRNTDFQFHSYVSDDGVIWQRYRLTDEDGVVLPDPVFSAPTYAGFFYDAGTSGAQETSVFGSARVLSGQMFVGVEGDEDPELYEIPFKEETLKPIGLVPVVPPELVSLSEEAIIHALVGAPFGDLEFDVGKSVGWLQRFVDDIFVTDLNRGDQRYWVVNWTKTFDHTYYKFSPVNYFTDPDTYRKTQVSDAFYHAENFPNELTYDDNDWVIFLDAHEGLSMDNRSQPDDYLIAPFKSFIYREIARANATGRDRIILPFFVFLAHKHIQNVSQSYGFEDLTFTATQACGVPYYLTYLGLTRMFRVSALRNPAFDWSIIDTPVPLPVDQAAEPPYLKATVGTASTPDPGRLPNESTFIFKVRGPEQVGTTLQTVVAQYDADPQRSWLLRRNRTSGAYTVTATPTGSAAGAVGRSVNGITPTQVDEWLAVGMKINDGSGNMRLNTWTSANGNTWSTGIVDSNAGTSIIPFDSTGPIRIGAYTAAGDVWNGRIYQVELRNGLNPAAGGSGGAPPVPGYVSFPGTAGNSLSVADAANLRLSGSTDLTIICRVAHTDWTPGVTSTLVSKWEGGKLGYLFRMFTNGTLGLAWSADGTSVTGNTQSTAVVSAPDGSWKWLAVTLDVNNGASGRTSRYWTSNDGVTWTKLGNDIVEATVTTLSTATAPLFFGLQNSGVEQFKGDCSYISIRNGIGTNGVPGGTEVFTYDAAIDLSPSLLSTSTSFVATTGQVVTVNRSAANPKTAITATTAGVIWRFNVAEYPGTGTSYVDPRGRTWTLTNAAAVVPYQPPDVKLQVISYAYAHWNLQDVPPGETQVLPLTPENDDGWRQRCMISQVVAVPGLPVGSPADPVGTWISPTADPQGQRGPWCFDTYGDLITDAVIPFPPPRIDDPVEMVRVPMYDTIFRLNVRDGVWYVEGGTGNAHLMWDEDLQDFVVNPASTADIV